MDERSAARDGPIAVATGDVGSHYHRNHRYPGTHPLGRRRFFAISYRDEAHVVRAHGTVARGVRFLSAEVGRGN
jgi:hypothetical protein